MGKLKLTKASLNALLNSTVSGMEFDDVNLNTTSLRKHLRIFEDKIGENIPLSIDLRYEGMNV